MKNKNIREHPKFSYSKPTPIEIFLCEITSAPPLEGGLSSLFIKAKNPTLLKLGVYPKVIRLLILFTLMLMVNESSAQDHSAAMNKADTVNFSVNKSDNWQLFNSYVSPYKTDSAQLELIIQHDKNINWSTDQYVGKIKDNALRPQTTRVLSFKLMTGVYRLKIETSGKCYLSFVSGGLPPGNPIVIPLRVLYKL